MLVWYDLFQYYRFSSEIMSWKYSMYFMKRFSFWIINCSRLFDLVIICFMVWIYNIWRLWHWFIFRNIEANSAWEYCAHKVKLLVVNIISTGLGRSFVVLSGYLRCHHLTVISLTSVTSMKNSQFLAWKFYIVCHSCQETWAGRK